MQRALAHALLVAGLALAAPVPAQLPGAPKPSVEAEAHIFSAFTSRADPRVLAENVRLGPALRGQLGADAGGRQVYEALVERTTGKPLRSRTLSIAEATSHASLGVNTADPLVLVEADDVRLLMQYSPPQRHVAFVEQLSGPAAVLPPSKPSAEAPPPAPIVEVPLPTAPPPPPVVAPAAPLAAPVFVPAPAAPTPAPKPRAPVATVAPTPKPAALPKPAAPAAAVTPRAAPRPRGECVIKPVMSEDDLWNCSAPGQASSPLIAAPVAAQSPAPAPQSAQPAARPPAECVIKPVMSEEDLRNCAAVSRSRSTAAMEVAAPAVAAQSSAPPPALQAAPPPECVIRPVMSEEDLRICAAVSKSRPAPAMETAAPQPVAAQPAFAAPAAARDCVIKPVMSEEDLRACGVRR